MKSQFSLQKNSIFNLNTLFIRRGKGALSFLALLSLLVLNSHYLGAQTDAGTTSFGIRGGVSLLTTAHPRSRGFSNVSNSFDLPNGSAEGITLGIYANRLAARGSSYYISLDYQKVSDLVFIESVTTARGGVGFGLTGSNSLSNNYSYLGIGLSARPRQLSLGRFGIGTDVRVNYLIGTRADKLEQATEPIRNLLINATDSLGRLIFEPGDLEVNESFEKFIVSGGLHLYYTIPGGPDFHIGAQIDANPRLRSKNKSGVSFLGDVRGSRLWQFSAGFQVPIKFFSRKKN